MPTTLAISFPWGRYHATPWGRNVNEAAVEWPPSPWRILRSLYATWKTRAPHLDEAVVHDLLRALAAPPSFGLPPHTEGHTRHYLPDVSHMKGRPRHKALDAFVVMERGADVLVEWPVDLAPDQRSALATLAELLPYLGRAESVCEARLLGVSDHPTGVTWVEPVKEDRELSAGRAELVLSPGVPLDVAALTVRTLDLQKSRRMEPPGSIRVPYPATKPTPFTTPPRVVKARPVTAVRWRIASPARPADTAAVVMADALRQALMSQFGRHFENRRSATIAGKDADGHPLKGHGHAHYIAYSADGGGLLDTLVLWAPTGVGQDELRAAAALRSLSGRSFIREFRPCRLGLEAFGLIEEVAPELCGPGTTWESFTPFAPPRHAKRRVRWEDHLATQVREELERRGESTPVQVQRIEGPWLSYRRYRIRERLEDARRAGGLRLTFDEPVGGPLSLGALGHFGLGLFIPVRDTH